MTEGFQGTVIGGPLAGRRMAYHCATVTVEYVAPVEITDFIGTAEPSRPSRPAPVTYRFLPLPYDNSVTGIWLTSLAFEVVWPEGAPYPRKSFIRQIMDAERRRTPEAYKSWPPPAVSVSDLS